MTIELQHKIRNNEYYRNYLLENSQWYKYLNRNPNSFKAFEEEVKDYYKLRPSHKITKAIDTLELIQTFMSTIS